MKLFAAVGTNRGLCYKKIECVGFRYCADRKHLDYVTTDGVPRLIGKVQLIISEDFYDKCEDPSALISEMKKREMGINSNYGKFGKNPEGEKK